MVDFVNAGQGDCIHVTCPNKNSVLVDCGSAGKADPELEDIIEGLVSTAPEVRVVLTHQDLDHYSKLGDALETASSAGKIKAVYVGGPRSWLPADPSPTSTKKSERLAAWLDEHGATYPAPGFNGADLACGDDITIDVLLAGFDTKTRTERPPSPTDHGRTTPRSSCESNATASPWCSPGTPTRPRRGRFWTPAPTSAATS